MGLFLMGMNSCQKNPRPDWEAKFWSGDSKTASILRAQNDGVIACSAPAFDNYVCISYEDLQKLESDVLSKCEKWSDVPKIINIPSK